LTNILKRTHTYSVAFNIPWSRAHDNDKLIIIPIAIANDSYGEIGVRLRVLSRTTILCLMILQELLSLADAQCTNMCRYQR